MTTTVHSAAPLRLILDTNIWIDILVFNDPHTQLLQAGLRSGALRAVLNDRCREELRRVLDYPQFKRFAIDQTAALAWADAHSTLHRLPEETVPSIKLPVCKDLDDQKFLELARDAEVKILLSKDKLVLKTRSRMARAIGCELMLPQTFNLQYAAQLAHCLPAAA